MSAFLTPLECRYIDPWRYWNNGGWHSNDGVDRWQLTSPFRYRSDLLRKTVEVPLGFRFDKASVPTLPFIYAAFGGRYTKPACVHDFLCRDKKIKREKADLVFLEAMRTENADEIQAMRDQGEDDDEIYERKAEIEGRAQMMYMAVAAYTKTGLWKGETDQPDFEPII